MIGRNAKGACEKVIDFPLERAFGLIKKEGDEDRESELALAAEGGGFSTMLLDEIGFVKALKKLRQRGE